MMKKIFALVITLFAILLMALTCPDKKAHTEAIRSAVSGYVNETLSQRQDDGIVMGFFLTSSSCHPKVFVKEFCYFLMSCHQHCLGVNLLVQR